jgi:hypothetical protein
MDAIIRVIALLWVAAPIWVPVLVVWWLVAAVGGTIASGVEKGIRRSQDRFLP